MSVGKANLSVLGQRFSGVDLKLRLVCILAGVICVLVAAGCSDDRAAETVSHDVVVIDNSDTVSPTVPTDVIEEPDTAPPIVPTEAIEATEVSDLGEELRNDIFVLSSLQCGIADPAIDEASIGFSAFDFRLVNEIHAGLTQIADKGIAVAEPALAESFSVGEDGMSYEFSLRKDLKFSDGSPLTAEDVKWSWERALILSTGISRANDVLGWIEGADTVVFGESEDLSGVEVVDDFNLSVRLSVPRSDFLMLMADPIAYVLKRENVEEWMYEWANNPSDSGTYGHTYGEAPGREAIPVGAGPFKLIDYAPDSFDEHCALERNEHYWEGPAQLGGVKVDSELLLSRLPHHLDPLELEQQKFYDGELDYVFPSFSLEDGEPSHLNDEGGEWVEVEEPLYTQFLIFNPAHPPFDDVHFRRALVAASDIDVLYPFGAYWPRRLVPESISRSRAGFEGQGYDLAVAVSNLRESRYIDSVDDLEIGYISPGGQAGFLSGLFDSWDDNLGVEVESWDGWAWADRVDFEGVDPYDELLDSGRLSMRYVSEPLQYPDPHAVLRFFVSPFGIGHSSPELLEVEAMIRDAVGEQDATERDRKYRDIEMHIFDQALALPLRVADLSYEVLVQPWVNGLRFPRYNGSVFYDVWFDDSAPGRSLR